MKNATKNPLHKGFDTNFAATAGVACKLLQHGKSPHEFGFTGAGCCFACIGQPEGIPPRSDVAVRASDDANAQ